MLVPRERLGWGLLAAGVSLWVVGDAIWKAFYYPLAQPPEPSVSDAFWVAFYPFAYAGIAVLIGNRARRVGAAIRVDGLIAALAVAAASAALIYDAVLNSIDSPLASNFNLTYVLADALLLALVLVAVALNGWHLDRAWAWIGGALAAFAVTDSAYLYEVSHGTYENGELLDAGWAIALLLIAVAAWNAGPPRRLGERAESWRSIMVPIAFGALALAIEAYDHFHQVTVLSLVFATTCLLAVMGRLAMTFGQNLRLLEQTREQARTDPLTGLGNRRQLIDDLQELIKEDLGDRPEDRILVMLDLDFFKEYNDRFGHLAGDALLERIATRLEESLRPWGRAYRLGGDEFCALLEPEDQAPPRLTGLASSALSEVGDGFALTSSAGWVLVPSEAHTPSDALRLADRRMYAEKGLRGGPAAARAGAGRRATRSR